MQIQYYLTVPAHVAADPDRLVPYVQARLPTSVSPDAMTVIARRPEGLTIAFALDYPNLNDARQAIAAFFSELEKIPEPPPAEPKPGSDKDASQA